MKRQILWKCIDILGQSLVMILSHLYPFYDDFYGRFLSGFFVTLFALGGWQTLSALLHGMLFPKRYWLRGRKGYNITLITTLAVHLTIVVVNHWALDNFALLILIGPAMAVWYYNICICEIGNLIMLNRQMKGSASIEDKSQKHTFIK